MFKLFRALVEKLEDTRKAGHYVAARVSDDTTEALKQWCRANKVPVSKDFFDNLHVTLCYSTTLFPIDRDEIIDDLSDWSVKPLEFDEFGKHDDKRFLVLKIKCSDATKRWQFYMDQGASYDFDEYLPHITLAQNFDGDIKKLDVDSLPELVLSSEYYEALSD